MGDCQFCGEPGVMVCSACDLELCGEHADHDCTPATPAPPCAAAIRMAEVVEGTGGLHHPSNCGLNDAYVKTRVAHALDDDCIREVCRICQEAYDDRYKVCESLAGDAAVISMASLARRILSLLKEGKQ